MSSPDRSPPPPENSSSSSNYSALGAEQWIMKSLNEAREDLKEIKESISGLDDRVGSLERKAMRVVYTVAGAGTVVFLIFGAYKFASNYIDFSIKIKESPAESQSDQP